LSGIASIDADLMLLINGVHSQWADTCMFLVSSKWSSIPVYVLLAVLLFRKYKNQFPRLLLAVVVMILVSDQLSNAFKYLVERPRPCQDADLQHLVHLVNNKCGGLYGFYSAHASNTAALALFSASLLESRYLKIGLMLWCFFIGYSRVYLGAHYPGDIFAGWFAGSCLGWIAFKLFDSGRHLIFRKLTD
jgi:undecaprenyl-diphosphatase